MELQEVIKRPSGTEKSIRMMESENKLMFVVDIRATKQEIKQALEKTFKAKIERVTTHITPQGEKKAFVKFSKEIPAIDIATQLGLM